MARENEAIRQWLSADIVMADMRVIQGRSDPCFALEWMLQVRIGTKLRRQDLNRNLAVKPRVSRPVHLASARPAETEPHKAPASFPKRVPSVSRNYSRPATERTLAAFSVQSPRHPQTNRFMAYIPA